MQIWPASGSFAESMLERSIFSPADVADEIPDLAPEHLEYILGITISDAVASGMQPDVEFCTLGVAVEILRFFMGFDWVDKSCFAVFSKPTPHVTTLRGFLNTNQQDPEAQFRWMERITRLATLLYNFQNTPGIQHRIATLHLADVESALGELECARLVNRPGRQFRFVIPVGLKGADYEAEFITPAGRPVCCEIKTKASTTNLSERTIWNTCEKARRQLPEDRPGIIFIRLPEEWCKKAGGQHTVQAGIDKVLRQSSRIVAVVTVHEEWHPNDAGRIVVYAYRTHLNRKSALYGSDIEQSITPVLQIPRSSWWFDIALYVANNLPSLVPRVRDHLIRYHEGE